MSLERSQLDEAKKKHQTIEKVEMSKMPTVNALFLTNNYIHNKFVIKKGFNHHHFFIDEKNFKKIWSDRKTYLFNDTTLSFLLFKFTFWFYSWLNSG